MWGRRDGGTVSVPWGMEPEGSMEGTELGHSEARHRQGEAAEAEKAGAGRGSWAAERSLSEKPHGLRRSGRSGLSAAPAPSALATRVLPAPCCGISESLPVNLSYLPWVLAPHQLKGVSDHTVCCHEPRLPWGGER